MVAEIQTLCATLKDDRVIIKLTDKMKRKLNKKAKPTGHLVHLVLPNTQIDTL